MSTIGDTFDSANRGLGLHINSACDHSYYNHTLAPASVCSHSTVARVGADCIAIHDSLCLAPLSSVFVLGVSYWMAYPSLHLGKTGCGHGGDQKSLYTNELQTD